MPACSAQSPPYRVSVEPKTSNGSAPQAERIRSSVSTVRTSLVVATIRGTDRQPAVELVARQQPDRRRVAEQRVGPECLERRALLGHRARGVEAQRPVRPDIDAQAGTAPSCGALPGDTTSRHAYGAAVSRPQTQQVAAQTH